MSRLAGQVEPVLGSLSLASVTSAGPTLPSLKRSPRVSTSSEPRATFQSTAQRTTPLKSPASVDKYAASASQGPCLRAPAPSAAAAAAISFACAQLGLPYVWGGNGPQHGDTGFDCSGLTSAAYAAAGVNLPRTADAQFRVGTRVLTDQPLLPGDLVFYGITSYIHHVGMYIGANMMIDAPDFNQVVKIEPYRYQGDDYAGASRPVT
jgi:cell wall-associated NlpC family hydrolase